MIHQRLKITRALVMAGMIAGAFSCSKPLEKGIPIADDAFVKLRAGKENDGKRFSITGYPALDNDIGMSPDRDALLNIYSEPEGKGMFVAALPVDFGTGKNKFHVPETFTTADITIYDNDGNKHGHTERLRYSFTLILRTDQPRIQTPLLHRVDGRLEQDEIMIYSGNTEAVRIDPLP